MVNRAVVERLLNNVETYIGELRAASDIDRKKLEDDVRSRRFVERSLQIAVEACLDTVHHIISDHGWREPESYADAFTVLAEHAVIDADLAETCQLMAQFRNKVVHYYGDLDSAQIYAILKDHLVDFDELIKAIRSWLDRSGDDL